MEPRPIPPHPPIPPSRPHVPIPPAPQTPPAPTFVAPSMVQRNIRTFQNDMADSIQSKPISVAHIAIAQHSRDDESNKSVIIRNEQTHPDRGILKKTILLLLSIMFVIAGLIGGYYFYTQSMLARIQAPITETITVSVMTTEQTKSLGVSADLRKNIAGAVRNPQNFTIDLSQSANILITNDLTTNPIIQISSSEFLSTIGSKAPNTLVRALQPEFMLGVYRGTSGDKPFLILKNSNFQNSYAGLLLWENEMFEDLSWLFAPVGSEDTASSISNLLAFSDTIIKNKDARILVTKQGNFLISYAFADPDTIIITSDPLTLSALIDNIEKEAFIRKK